MVSDSSYHFRILVKFCQKSCVRRFHWACTNFDNKSFRRCQVSTPTNKQASLFAVCGSVSVLPGRLCCLIEGAVNTRVVKMVCWCNLLVCGAPTNAHFSREESFLWRVLSQWRHITHATLVNGASDWIMPSFILYVNRPNEHLRKEMVEINI